MRTDTGAIAYSKDPRSDATECAVSSWIYTVRYCMNFQHEFSYIVTASAPFQDCHQFKGIYFDKLGI